MQSLKQIEILKLDGNADGENAEVDLQLTFGKGETEEETIKPIRDKGSWKWK